MVAPASPSFAPAAPSSADPTAVFGRRVFAALIDGLLLLVPAALLFTSTFEYLEVEQLDRSGAVFCEDYMDELGGFCADLTEINDRVYFSEGPDAGSSLVLWGGGFVLHVLLQGLTGLTVGKLLVGIRTVKEDGTAPGIGKALVRWLLLVVDGQPCGLPLVGAITAGTTTGHRRVGDMAAKTFVVRRAAMGSPIQVPGMASTALAAGSYGDSWSQPAPPPGAAWGPPPTASPSAWDTPVAPGPAAEEPGAGAGPEAEQSAGWAAPGAPGAAGPAGPAAPPPPAAAPGPQWDAARGTYIQWDPSQARWVQWDETARTWTVIPGQ